MSSDSSSDDMYHCPECGFEWGGYDRAPPYANCPKCDDAVMRRGRYTEEETGGSVRFESPTDLALYLFDRAVEPGDTGTKRLRLAVLSTGMALEKWQEQRTK